MAIDNVFYTLNGIAGKNKKYIYHGYYILIDELGYAHNKIQFSFNLRFCLPCWLVMIISYKYLAKCVNCPKDSFIKIDWLCRVNIKKMKQKTIYDPVLQFNQYADTPLKIIKVYPEILVGVSPLL